MIGTKISIVKRKDVAYEKCLAIDVAKGKSMVSLISSCGDVLIKPYEISHYIKDF